MKTIIATLLVLLAFNSHAADAYYLINGSQGTKVEALRALLNDPKANVVKCTSQTVSDKATLKNK